MTGIELIVKERKEQIEKHGCTIEHDIEFNSNHELVEASITLSINHEKDEEFVECLISNKPEKWGSEIWEKMVRKSYKERLIIAGALLAAEIDRLQEIESGATALDCYFFLEDKDGKHLDFADMAEKSLSKKGEEK